MRGTRQLVLVLVAMVAAVVLASGLAAAATLVGTSGDDNIEGTSGSDAIAGKEGKDTIEGMAGYDTVAGESGDDALYGGDAEGSALAGNDMVDGGDGNDTVTGGPGADVLYGGNGNDTIYVANLPASMDFVSCGVGTDEVVADSQDQVASDCENVEIIHANGDPNTITGTVYDDTIHGHGNDDTISGKGGADTLYGGDGDDKLFGTDEYQTGLADGHQTSVDGNDVIDGNGGRDTVVGASGADELRGGENDDIIIEGPANDAAQDTMLGNEGNDKLNAVSDPASRDVVDCGSGTDEVQADPLDDINVNCENVEIIDEVQEQSTVTAQNAEAEEQPAVISTEGAVGEEQLPAPSSEPQETSGEVSAQGYYYVNFSCTATAAYRGSRLCAVADPGAFDEVGVGVYDTYPTHWLWVTIWQGSNYIEGRRLHETHNRWDYFYTSGFGFPAGIYARTSCWSNCWRSTWYEGYFTVDY
jgi:Ca2+-binding RTX toxin-like protein